VQLQQLQQTVAELKASYKELQGHYHKAFAGQGAAEDNSKKLAAIVEVQAKRIRELEVQFHTPVKPFFAASTQGEPPSLASMPVTAGGMFSPLPGAPGVRTDRDWEQSAIGKVDVVTANQKLFQSVTSIQVDPVQIYQDENTVVAELIVTINSEIRLLVTDVITFTGDKISSVRAYKG
jgi:hypothetical protein